jgi:cellulose synthase/poly-beta-1,6-N-acetylglucosamine synthase-like glycosyltransferase
MELLFWLSVGLIVYVYAGYPVVLGVWAWIVGKSEIDDSILDRSADALPGVTVIIAARDEARRLPGRIDNLLASDYPQDRLQIIVASDGSTDNTLDTLAQYTSRVELVMLPPGGKARALNAAVSRARYPILVFADARQRFAPDAIRRLVRHFSQASVGAVSGELVLDCERADFTVGRDESAGAADGDPSTVVRGAVSHVERQIGPTSTIGDGLSAYWKYEKWLRRHEAIVGSTLGATGAIYAMRRTLWQPLPPDTILDDVLGPMRVVLRRQRVLFDATAHAFDETASDAAVETRRKVRTLAGNFQLLALEPRLLLPMVNPVWLQFVSHKLGRLLVPYALVVALATSVWLAPRSLVYAFAFGAQVVFYGLAIYGAWLDRRDRRGIGAQAATTDAAYSPVLKRNEAA